MYRRVTVQVEKAQCCQVSCVSIIITFTDLTLTNDEPELLASVYSSLTLESSSKITTLSPITITTLQATTESTTSNTKYVY